MPTDRDYLLQAVELAKAAQEAGNLPIGAVIVLNDTVIAEGQNRLWQPVSSPALHAEIDALNKVAHELWVHAPEMTLYTTLEPCLMCLSTILLHGIGQVVYGANDPWGGGMCATQHMPPAFKRLQKAVKISGPALPEFCDPLFDEVAEILAARRAKKE